MRSKQEILEFHKANAERNGYYLTPDKELLDDLIGGLAANEERYGYGSCPCRMSGGIKNYDSDIICPCEYRDADVNEFGMCYCCLYVSKEVRDDPSKMGPVPERRAVEIQDAAMELMESHAFQGQLEYEYSNEAKDRLDAGEGVMASQQDSGAKESKDSKESKNSSSHRGGDLDDSTSRQGSNLDDASLSGQGQGAKLEQSVPVWRCVVCGYLAAREGPPPICPICKAKAERFERFSLG